MIPIISVRSLVRSYFTRHLLDATERILPCRILPVQFRELYFHLQSIKEIK